MSFKNTARVIIVLGIIALFLHSCIISDRTIGSGLIPDDHILKIRTAEIALPVEMALSDTIQSDSPSIILGTLYDETFGKISSNSAVGLFIRNTDSIDFGVNPILKKAYLDMYIDSTTVLTNDQNGITQNLRVYELNRALDTATLYNNSLTRSDYSNKPVSTKTVITTGSNIHVEFTEEFVRKILNTPQEKIDSAALFSEYHHGLYFEMDPPITESGGRLNYITCNGKRICLDLTYTDPKKNLYNRDTTFYIYLGSYNLSVSTPLALNTFEKQSATIDMSTDNRILVSPFNGVKPYINALSLKKSVQQWADYNSVDLSKIIISRASMEFPYDENTDYLDLARFPKSLFPCARIKMSDTMSIKMYLPIDEVYSPTVSHGYIDRSLSFYKPDITTYLYHILKKDDDTFGYYDNVWLIPIKVTTDSYYGTTSYDVSFNPYYKGVLNGTNSSRRPVLKIAYSILN